jgi:hypothetical protein|tara:strand:- start:1618 stop:2157 length:540 start_codon:yes stop_codon:yes gene_type:complete
MTDSNVDNLVDGIPNYASGFMRHNRYNVNMYTTVGTYTNVPAFAVRLPGWDVGTVAETGVAGNIKMFPFRKNWNQSLFVTFYMEKDNQGSIFDFINQWVNNVAQPQGIQPYYNERIAPNTLEVVVGDNNKFTTWSFGEVYPRVLYPVELKPVEDFAPFIFSVQFVYRYFDLYANGNMIG